MPNLSIIYIAGFNIDRNTGRNKATREKTDALKELIGEANFKLYYPRRIANKLLANLPLLFFDLQMFFRLISISKNTVVIQRQTILPLSNCLLRIKKLRVIYELHTDLKSELPYLDKNRFQKILIRLLILSEHLNMKLCSAIVINSPSLEPLIRKYNKPFLCSYNGANSKDFYPLDKLECRIGLGLEPSSKYFLFSGMISKWHGVEMLIRIFNEDILSDQVLLIIGTGKDSYSNSLKQLSNNAGNIRFIDFIPTEKLNIYMNAADICLLPVNNIRSNLSSPLKLYDYIACGKPVIAQENLPGYADEVMNHNLGRVLDFNEIKHSAIRLSEWSGEFDFDYYRVHNRELASTVLSWNSRMKGWIDFINKLGV